MNDLSGIAVFAAVAEAGSFTKAGERLNLSKSAVSKQVSKLEERLGAQLIDVYKRQGQSYPADAAPILIAHGGADAAISMDEVAQLSRELEAAGVPYEIQVYSGAPHAFTVFGSDRYREVADRQSWDAFGDFLATHLGD